MKIGVKPFLVRSKTYFKRAYKTWGKGDTIVEVMMSMAILAIVVTVTYSLSSRAFQSGLNSQYRDQAISYAQQQVELIKEADNNTPQTIDSYKSNNPNKTFCIDPATKNRIDPNNPDDCLFNSLYKVTYKYKNNTFQVTATWDSASGANQQTVIYYKPSNSFNGNLQAVCQPNDPLCAPVVTNKPSIGLSVDNSSVYINDKVNLTWNINNVNLNTCAANGAGGFSGANVKSENDSYTTTPLTPEGSYIFKITCNDNAGNPVVPPGSLTVTVKKPLPDANTGGANPVGFNSATVNGTVNPHGFATTYVFNYGLTNAYGSTSSQGSAGAGNGLVPASNTLTGLQSNKTYHFQICATNAYGTTCGDDVTFKTTVPPNPTLSFTADSYNFNAGNGTTLHWNTTNVPSGQCSASGSWNGIVGSSGNSPTGALGAGVHTYALSCAGYSGTPAATGSVTITVNAVMPHCNVSASGSRVNSTTVSISGGGSGCDFYNDSEIGPNGGFGPLTINNRPAPYSHTQCGGFNGWGTTDCNGSGSF